MAADTVSRSARRVSVIVPTINEEENVDGLLRSLLETGESLGLELEVVVVDDGSTDRTREMVRAWTAAHPIRLVERERQGGLAGAVLAGAAEASSDVVVVMDADLSHPVETLGALAAPILDDECEMVIGSRYVPGGSTPGWPLRRRLASRAAGSLARLLVDVRDPLSGFFAARREALLRHGRQASGFKIGLEVLVRGGPALRVKEVPISFKDRAGGASKTSRRVALEFLWQVARLAGSPVSLENVQRFGAAAFATLTIDFALLLGLLAGGVGLPAAHVASLAVSAAAGWVLQTRWAFRGKLEEGVTLERAGAASFGLFALLSFFLRGGVITLLSGPWGFAPVLAAAGGALAAAAVQVTGWCLFIFSGPAPRGEPRTRWRVGCVAAVGYLVLLHLVYAGQIELLPEEAYYWNYAKHLDIGYLDHPPLVAWLIGAGTLVWSDTELAVRAGAVVSSLVTILFIALMVRDALGREAAFIAGLLASIFPYFFAAGFLMTPDAPLVACWAGSLFFLQRALVRGQSSAWIGAGLCLGVGMLAKYSIALLGLSTLVYCAADGKLRHWLRRPGPYAAILLVAVIFLPVVLWNARNGWASFTFQTQRRLERHDGFQLHVLLAYVLLLLTPAGIAWTLRGISVLGRSGAEVRRRVTFFGVFTCVPLLVFAVASLGHQTKINWTGPVWLASVPFMAAALLERPRRAVSTGRLWPSGALQAGCLAVLCTYGAVLQLPVLPLPGLRLPNNYYGTSWRDLGRKVDAIEREVLARTGAKPLVVGMDKYHLSSELAFYDPGRDAGTNTAGLHLFGRKSLMYSFWYPPEDQEGKSMVLVSRDAGRLKSLRVRERFKSFDPPREIEVMKHGRVVERFHCQVAHGYHVVEEEKSGGIRGGSSSAQEEGDSPPSSPSSGRTAQKSPGL